jgi:hypothetical protein
MSKRAPTRRATPLLVAVLVAACGGKRLPSTIMAETPGAVLSRLTTGGHAVDAALGGGRVRYLGFEALPEGALPGDEVRLTHYWVATAALDRPYRVFVHSLVQGAAGWIEHGDHLPVPSPDHWPDGKVVRDEHVLHLPARLPGDEVELRVGLYLGNERLKVDRVEQQDGQDRVLAGRFRVSGTPVPIPSYRAPRLLSPPTFDGRIDDKEWGQAPWIEGFSTSRGDRVSSVKTRMRVAWDRTHVYVAWELEDRDLVGTMTKRDEPIYREEAVEMFIDPTRSKLNYVELQTSPAGVIFDAKFTGGARRHPDPSYDAGFTAKVVTEGTLNNPTDVDRGYRAEWQIDVASIPEATSPLTAGTCWRVNFFRIAKDRVQGRELTDESAWSPPLMGDFHNLERFGDLCFTD